MTDEPHARTHDSPPDRDSAARTDHTASTEAIERSLERLSPPGARTSVLAVRPATGAVVAATDPDAVVAPASNTKLITAALALDRLGPDHRIETSVAALDRVADGVLEGDLVLRGAGEPDLTTEDLAALAAAVADELDRVEGDLVCEVAHFDGPQLGPGRVWSDEHHAYGARSSALALSGNVATVTVAATDGAVTVSVSPGTDAVDVDADVTTGDGRASDEEDLTVRPDRGTGLIRVEGAVPAGETRTVEVPVPAPVRHCGLAARDALAGAGVEVDGSLRVVEDRLETDRELGAVRSAPVRELVGSMNVDSDNFVADQLARTTAAAVSGEGSWDAWTALVEDHFVTLGVETVRIRDGSGLSRYDLVPARGMVALLEWAAGQPWSDSFFGSLPGPGAGTLAERLEGVPVVAKTGTLTGTRALSGRVGRGDAATVFSCIVDGITTHAEDVRDRQDAFVRALAAASDGED